MILAEDILINSYRVQDCSDFGDIANSIENIMINCSIYNKTIYQFKSVQNRIYGYAKLFKLKKYSLKTDMKAYSHLTYYTDILQILKIYSKC